MADQVPVRPGLFAEGEGRSVHLIGGRCETCGRHHFPLLGTCPYCSSFEVGEVPLSPVGTLWAWTAVTAAPPGYMGEVPYGFGIVELPEGIRVVTRLSEPDPARLSFGQPVELEVVPLHEDGEGRSVVTYSFAPSGEASARGGQASAPRGEPR